MRFTRRYLEALAPNIKMLAIEQAKLRTRFSRLNPIPKWKQCLIIKKSSDKQCEAGNKMGNQKEKGGWLYKMSLSKSVKGS